MGKFKAEPRFFAKTENKRHRIKKIVFLPR